MLASQVDLRMINLLMATAVAAAEAMAASATSVSTASWCLLMLALVVPRLPIIATSPIVVKGCRRRRLHHDYQKADREGHECVF